MARDTRAELRLGPIAPFDPRILASHLAIPIRPLIDLSSDAPAAVRYFRGAGSGEFSAGTIFADTKRLIIYNDAHAPGRQASDLAHELSHALLFHEPTPALNAIGCRDWDEDAEDEADFLAGVLLVPDEVAIAVVRRGLSIEDAAAEYGVSGRLMQWRINVTGARKRVERARQALRRR